MTRWQRLWYRALPTGASQAWWHALLLLMALDCAIIVLWHPSVAHGSSSFNVAHIAPLSALPVSAELHLGARFVAGFVAFAMVVTGPRRLGFAVVAAAYSYSWMMSRLDSYQHHYFLSLALFVGAFADHEPAEEEAEQWPRALLLATVAVLYLFTAVAKIEPMWLGGATVRHVVESAPGLAAMLPASDGFFVFTGIAIIAVELAIAAGYALAVARPGARRWLWAAAILAVGLHASIELLGLRIGLFSYYMIALALLTLGGLGSRFGEAVAWRRRQLARIPDDKKLAVLVAAVAGGLLVVTGQMVSLYLPGAVAMAGVVAVVAVLGAAVVGRRVALGACAALVAWWVAVAVSPVEATLMALRPWLGEG